VRDGRRRDSMLEVYVEGSNYQRQHAQTTDLRAPRQPTIFRCISIEPSQVYTKHLCTCSAQILLNSPRYTGTLAATSINPVHLNINPDPDPDLDRTPQSTILYTSCPPTRFPYLPLDLLPPSGNSQFHPSMPRLPSCEILSRT